MIKLIGTNLAGMSTTRDRMDNDYYATPSESTKALLEAELFEGGFIEPCVGGGHIADVIKEYYPDSEVLGIDLINRGYPETIVKSYFDYNFNGDYNIITNPPYSIAQEFLEHSMNQLNEGKKIAMFLKIQFLESEKRKKMFEKYPPKTIYVFSKRQNPLRNGNPLDEKGKPWNSTMCFAWFVWEKGSTIEPMVRWL